MRYLSDFGWQATVVSLGPACNEELYDDIRRVRSLTPWHRPYEVTPYGWTIPVFKTARQLLGTGDFDLIYISCPPFIHAGALNRLANAFGVPSILDLRDAWSLDPYVEGSRLKKTMHKFVFPRWEKFAFHKADRILVNTPSVLDGYRRLYPHLGRRFALLPNGYDESDFAGLEATCSPADRPLTVVHVGRFGIGNRNPALILDALRMLKRNGVAVIFRIIGSPTIDRNFNVNADDLSGMVDVIPTIPHADALAELLKADVALLYQESSCSKVTAVAGKTHEYIRSGKPIVAIAPPGDNLDLVRAMAGFSIIIQQPASAQMIADELRQLAELKARGELPIHATARTEYLETYSRWSLTRTLVKQFEAAIEDL